MASTIKTCTACFQKLPVEQFARRAASADGLSSRCRACHRTKSQEYRARLAARPIITVPETKICRICEQELHHSKFTKRVTAKDGLRGACRSCRSQLIHDRREALQRRKMIIPPKEKRCPACKTTKPQTEFYKSRSEPSGLQCYCKPCFNEKRAEAGKPKTLKKPKP